MSSVPTQVEIYNLFALIRALVAVITIKNSQHNIEF